MSGRALSFDVIVIGAGLSGLMSATFLAGAGLKAGVFGKGGGYLHFATGCVDLLGRQIDGNAIKNPLAAIAAMSRQNPDHPYAVAGEDAPVAGVNAFRAVMQAAGLPFCGDLDRTIVLPTAIGAARPTCLAPAGMVAGSLNDSTPMLIVGFHHFRDFYPPYMAANLSRLTAAPVRHLYLDVPNFRNRRHLLSLDIARTLDDPDVCDQIGRLVKADLKQAGRVGFPAVLGLERHGQAVDILRETIGRPIFEIPTLPPSVAGMRVDAALRHRLRGCGVRLEIGFRLHGDVVSGRADEIVMDSAGHTSRYRAAAYILATGGTGGGGIGASADGSLRETVFDLEVTGGGSRGDWHRSEFLGRRSQPIALAGVRVDDHLRPFAGAGQVVSNVFVTASNLPHWDPVRERSGEGVALATAYRAATEAIAYVGGRATPTFVETKPV